MNAIGRDIGRRAAAVTGISEAMLFSRRRAKPEVTKVKQAMAVALRARGLSLPEIGRALGRHHTTVLHSLRQADIAAKRLADEMNGVPRSPRDWLVIE